MIKNDAACYTQLDLSVGQPELPDNKYCYGVAFNDLLEIECDSNFIDQ